MLSAVVMLERKYCIILTFEGLHSTQKAAMANTTRITRVFMVMSGIGCCESVYKIVNFMGHSFVL